MQSRQTKLLALTLMFAIAGIATAARNQSKVQPLKPSHKTDLDTVKPYRTWTKINKQPIVIKLDQSAFAG